MQYLKRVVKKKKKKKKIAIWSPKVVIDLPFEGRKLEIQKGDSSKGRK